MMINMTSLLTGLEVRLINFFLAHIGEQFAIREIARKAKIDYKLAHTTVQRLAQKEILLKHRQANVDLCSLNMQGDLTYVFYVEMLRTQDFLQKHPELRMFFSRIKERNKEMYCTLLVFGSFAKGTETKHSDIDLLIIVTARAVGEEMARIINTEATFLKHEVQTVVLDEREFVASLSEKKPNVATEAFKNHFIITGAESFYNGARRMP